MSKLILITGGAGFVGSNLAVMFKKDYPQNEVITFDNLKRRGSELNISRFKELGIKFVHGDVRNLEDLKAIGKIDLLIDCSAEPSVKAGKNQPNYVVNTNLIGTLNCLEIVREHKADLIFISTSRVYPIEQLNNLSLSENDNRLLINEPYIQGISSKGITEDFDLEGRRSLYGSTKLCSEILIREYAHYYNFRFVINRCGIIAGPWQMGKIDQGIFTFWLINHIFKKNMSYNGFGGSGKQVRDVLNIIDLYDLIKIQISKLDEINGHVFNIGGGMKNSVSLRELTSLCQKITNNKVEIGSIKETDKDDIPFYVSNCDKAKKLLGWEPKKDLHTTLHEIYDWINENKDKLVEVI